MPRKKAVADDPPREFERGFQVVICPQEHHAKYWGMMFDEVAAAARAGRDGLRLTIDGAPDAKPDAGYCSMRAMNHPGLKAHGTTAIVEQRF